VVDAVHCAIEVQNGMVERNAGLPPERRIESRIGNHFGDVVDESDGDLMGDGVNIAARLESICEPGATRLIWRNLRAISKACVKRGSRNDARRPRRSSPPTSRATRAS
jgi:class 3 adenylate cyclase